MITLHMRKIYKISISPSSYCASNKNAILRRYLHETKKRFDSQRLPSADKIALFNKVGQACRPALTIHFPPTAFGVEEYFIFSLSFNPTLSFCAHARSLLRACALCFVSLLQRQPTFASTSSASICFSPQWSFQAL